MSFIDEPGLKAFREDQERVERTRNLSTEEFLAQAIHNLHECGAVYAPGKTSEERLFWKEKDGSYTEPPPIYELKGGIHSDLSDAPEAVQRYTMSPELIVRLWLHHSYLVDGTGLRSGRTSFPTRCPICNIEIVDIFGKFIR